MFRIFYTQTKTQNRKQTENLTLFTSLGGELFPAFNGDTEFPGERKHKEPNITLFLKMYKTIIRYSNNKDIL